MLTTDPFDPPAAANASGFAPLPGRWDPLSAELPGITELVAELLCTHTQVLPLTMDHARMVVGYLRPCHAAMGQVLIREGDMGDGTESPDLLLILRGEVAVHTRTTADALGSEIELATLGPGDILGEMTLLDGMPRSATCTVTRDLLGASLSRSAMEVLAHDHPQVAARLMTAICERLVQRLRDNNQMLSAHMATARELQEQLHQAPGDGQALATLRSVV
jgi:CRP-like cAMP-binding protein